MFWGCLGFHICPPGTSQLTYDIAKYHDGWWDGEYIEYIRQILRRKFFSLLNEGEQLPDDAFGDLHAHLRDYATQQGMSGERGASKRFLSVLPSVSEVGGSGRVSATPGIGENLDEMFEGGDEERDGTPSAFASGRKISSLRHKSKRNTKPRAKVLGSEGDKAERIKSRLSQTVEPEAIENWAASVPSLVHQETIAEEPEPEASLDGKGGRGVQSR